MASIFGNVGVETPKFTIIKALAGANKAELRQYGPQICAEVVFNAQPGSGAMDGLGTAFRTLAGFIFGGNTSRTKKGNEKIAMTAPVTVQKASFTEKIAMTAPVIVQQTASGTASGADAAVNATAPGATDTDTTAATDTAAAADTTTAAADTMAAGGGSSQRTMLFVMPSKYKKIEDLPVPKDPNVRLVEVPARTMAAIRFNGNLTRDQQVAREAELRAAAEKEGVKLSADPRDVRYCAYNPPWCLPFAKTNDILIPVLE